MKLTNEFKEAVYDVVAQIPEGRVMTYGDVAAAAGAPGAAWEVGQIAHWAPCQKLETCDAREHWMSGTRRTGLSGVQGNGEKRSAVYKQYGKRAPESLTQQSAKSNGRIDGSAGKQDVAACPACDSPWQRVVNKQGGLARAYTWGGLEGHKQELEAEGIDVSEDYTVDIDNLTWRPETFKQ